MQVTPPTTTSPTPAPTPAAPPSITDLGRDEFLKLLIAQLQNQDPLHPLEDRDFIVQLAQFQTLDQLEQLTQQLQTTIELQQFSSATALLGRTVEAVDEKGETVQGTVQAVAMEKGAAWLTVGETRVPLWNVLRVRSA
jgi:flagellar basal-body rod modification protein FlgD